MKNIFTGLIFFQLCITNHAEQLFLPFLMHDCQSNIIVIADPQHEKSCPVKYTNLISNTNLFTFVEQKSLTEIPLKYKDVTTNIGPIGTVFKGIELREWKKRDFYPATIFPVSCFVYTNSGAREEIAFRSSRQILINFRTPSEDGYNANLIDGKFGLYQEYKHGVLSGLCVGEVFDKEHCNTWVRCANGKIVGRFLGWNEHGKINMEAEFPEPFNIVQCAIGQFDLTWNKVSTNQIELANPYN